MKSRKPIRSHHELDVYRQAFDVAMTVFELTREFPREERYALIDQMRRASRSVCTNITEAWRKRRYRAAFISKLSDAEAEAAETQTWIEFSVKCEYLSRETGKEIYKAYDMVIGKIVNMINQPAPWLLRGREE